MIKKTYGAHGMIEWHPVIKVGKAVFHFEFTNGALNAYGVTPAEYTTSDKVLQHVIENSAYFKQGRIKLIRKVEVADAPSVSQKAKVASGREVSSYEDAKRVMMDEFGIEWKQLRTKDAIKKMADSIGMVINEG
jgi:hypothetical protein